MPEENHHQKCKKCKSDFSGNYCPNCGHPRKLNRIDGSYILSEIGSVLNFDKGFLFTIRELLLRPGLSIRQFIREDRNRLVKPIAFIIITSLIYSISQQFFHFEDKYIAYSNANEESATLLIFSWISNNYGYGNIFMAIFVAFWIKVIFKKYNYNFFEIFILLSFLMGIGMLMLSILGAAESLTKLSILNKGGAIVVFLYLSWGIGQFFDKRKITNYFKGALSYILGMISFTIAALIIGVLIDLINKSH